MDKKYTVFLIPGLALTGLIVAGLFYVSHYSAVSRYVLEATLIIGTIPLIWTMVRSVLRGHFGVDLVAVTAIVTSFFVHQYLAGTVIVLMMSGGEALEDFAMQRAQKELTSLLSRAPTIAHLKIADKIKDVAANLVKVNDVIVIKPGEIVPVDGVVLSGSSDIDESTITGESASVEKTAGAHISSGTLNQDGVLEVQALRLAKESRFEQIIRLVKEAQESRAPIVRLADRYAVWFTIVTFAIALIALLVSHSAVRMLAVLVVATPCPLILATPIAVMSGMSWAASRGIIVKNGGAIEQLGEAKSFVFDKTGTITLGIPKVLGADAFANIPSDEVMRIAASLDQLSTHILARSLIRYAKTDQKLELSYPTDFEEVFGDGVIGSINGLRYLFGRLSFLKNHGVAIPEKLIAEHLDFQSSGMMVVYLAQNTELVGRIRFADVIRSEVKSVFDSVRAGGVSNIWMLTGDKANIAKTVAEAVGITQYQAECQPEDKLKKINQLKKSAGPVVMIGDGVNDAPALAAADVGIALGIHGGTAASDAGDVVITVNTMERVSEAFAIGRRVLHIAKQSIYFGIGLSIVLMVLAAAGFIRPVIGALLQEAIDVAVILNALRVHLDARKNPR